ncbi:MAG: patatin-like phospholipase family protein [Woeseiaceae bacterium]|nr:patatin-like phospholipase family protein [Woeseiaceae bacterium]
MSDDRNIGLALSGGGYRASLFHLGAMRRLNELGVLKNVGCISSVSGGSILSGFVADRMLAAGQNVPQFDDWETSVAQGFRSFVGKDIRTTLVLRYALINAIKPQWRAARLADVFRKRLTGRYLTDLPKEEEGTSFMFLATDFLESVAWEFEQHRVGHYRMTNKRRLPSDGISIAQAVAASASFPPIFGPVRLPIKKRNGRDEHVAWLTDGGVYDNLGMEPVWNSKNYDRVLISDGGGVLQKAVPSSYGGRLFRYSSIAMDQVRSRRQWEFIARIKQAEKHGDDYNGALWRNASKRKKFRQSADADGRQRIDKLVEQGWYGYDDSDDGTIDNWIARIRTDLDKFTTAESKILENHGYFNADIAIRAFLPEFLSDAAPFKVPHDDQQYLDDAEVRKHLKGSASRWRFIQRYFQ